MLERIDMILWFSCTFSGRAAKYRWEDVQSAVDAQQTPSPAGVLVFSDKRKGLMTALLELEPPYEQRWLGTSTLNSGQSLMLTRSNAQPSC